MEGNTEENSATASVADTSSRKESAERAMNGSTTNDERSSPECELPFNGRVWIDSAASTKTPVDECPSPGWMDQIDASDELKARRAEAEKKRSPAFKNATFLQIPAQFERYSHSLSYMTRLTTHAA